METAGGRSRTAFWAVAERVAEVAWQPQMQTNQTRRRVHQPCAGRKGKELRVAFKQREKKRKGRAAAAAAQGKSRETGSGQRKWWLTIVTKKASCNRHGDVLAEGRPMVYRHVPREVLCVPCADSDPSVTYRPSVRWERRRQADAARRGARARRAARATERSAA